MSPCSDTYRGCSYFYGPSCGSWTIFLPAAQVNMQLALMTILLTNVSRTLIWIPSILCLRRYLPVLSKKVLRLNTSLKFCKFGFLFRFSRWLDSDCGVYDVSMILAVGICTFVLYSTDSIEHMMLLVRKIKRRTRGRLHVRFREPFPRRYSPEPSAISNGSDNNEVRSIVTPPIVPRASKSALRDSLDSDSDESPTNLASVQANLPRAPANLASVSTSTTT